MISRIGLLMALLFAVVTAATAQQRVVRKGVQPTMVTKKPADPLYRLEQFQGKWQEIKRIPTGTNEPIGFTDTLLLKFEQNKVEIKDATSMRVSMRGVAQMEAPNLLIAAGDEFTVMHIDSIKLLINDGEFIREMQKKKQFTYETFGKESIAVDSFNFPVNIAPAMVEGKWIVYRRQALAGSVGNDAVVIKSIEIHPGETIGSSTGKVVYYQSDISKESPCKIIYGNGTFLIITDANTWEFSTYKADGQEFVFGEKGQLLYFAKKL